MHTHVWGFSPAVQFSSWWYLCAQKSPYALFPPPLPPVWEVSSAVALKPCRYWTAAKCQCSLNMWVDLIRCSIVRTARYGVQLTWVCRKTWSVCGATSGESQRASSTYMSRSVQVWFLCWLAVNRLFLEIPHPEVTLGCWQDDKIWWLTDRLHFIHLFKI